MTNEKQYLGLPSLLVLSPSSWMVAPYIVDEAYVSSLPAEGASSSSSSSDAGNIIKTVLMMMPNPLGDKAREQPLMDGGEHRVYILYSYPHTYSSHKKRVSSENNTGLLPDPI